MASLADPDEALRSTNAKTNFQRLTRLLMRGGVALLRETFDSIHPPATLPITLSDPTVQTQLKSARLTRPEWNCLYPSAGLYGKSSDFDITLTFRLLRTICNLSPPPTGWDDLPNNTDHSREADLTRVKYYRNEVYGHSKTMEVNVTEFVVLWKEISEALLRIAANISNAKQDEWKKAIDKFESDPLTPDEERCVKELQWWYKQEIDVKNALEKCQEGIQTLQEEIKETNQRIEKQLERLVQPLELKGPVEIHIENRVVTITVKDGTTIKVCRSAGTHRVQVLQAEVGAEGTCSMPIATEQGQASEAGNCQDYPSEMTIWTVLSSFERPLNFVFRYLTNTLNVFVRYCKLGSLEITVECSSLDILEGLWQDYRSGHLSEVVQETLVTAEVLEKLRLTDMKLDTFISKEEYEKGMQYFADDIEERVRWFRVKGNEAMQNKNHAEALRLLSRGVADLKSANCPPHYAALLLMDTAECYWQLDDDHTAMQFMENAIILGLPKDESFAEEQSIKWSFNGQTLLRRNEFLLAEKCADFALYFQTSSTAKARAHSCRALAKYGEGRKSEARNDIDEVKKLDESLARAVAEQTKEAAVANFKKQKYTQSLNDFDLALLFHPEDSFKAQFKQSVESFQTTVHQRMKKDVWAIEQEEKSLKLKALQVARSKEQEIKSRTPQGVTRYDTGAGIVYRLSVTQDVTIERGSTNMNSLPYLIVSKHPGFPNKRSLVQFEDLPSSCLVSQIHSAKMYLYYEYAHKSSYESIKDVPFIPRYLEVHLVKNRWNQAEATSTRRLTSTSWSSPYLGLDGTDAEATPQPSKVTIFPSRPAGFIEFDVTDAVKSWSGGVSNNGLVIRATNELDIGRDIRFASSSAPDSSKHPYILVRSI